MTLAYISIGSNLSSPLKQVNSAINSLKNIPHSKVIAISSFYRTLPLKSLNLNQPEYLNAVVALETNLNPEKLLYKIQCIETKQGRKRNLERWSPTYN